MFFFARGGWIPTKPLLRQGARTLESDDTALNKYTHFLKLRWPTLATLALCALLPGCPFTDDYFIAGAGSAAGAGQLLGAAGVSELSAGGAFPAAGGLDAGGSAELCSCASGGHLYVAGGSSQAGQNNTAGSIDDDAGSPGNDAGSPSTSAGGTGGNGGNLTTAGTANGGAETAGGPSNLPQPACASDLVKGSACTAGAPLCYKSCGPDNLGFKSETCQMGSYAESDCSFPTGQDYSCYKIPPSLSAKCPAGVPRGGSACSVMTCIVCYGPGPTPQYQDSTGAQKPGYCVCSDAGIWTCGSTMSGSWPCPGPGCN